MKQNHDIHVHTKTSTHNELTQLDAQKRNHKISYNESHTIKNTHKGTETLCNPQPYEKTLCEKIIYFIVCLCEIYMRYEINKMTHIKIIYSIVCLCEIHIFLYRYTK